MKENVSQSNLHDLPTNCAINIWCLVASNTPKLKIITTWNPQPYKKKNITHISTKEEFHLLYSTISQSIPFWNWLKDGDWVEYFNMSYSNDDDYFYCCWVPCQVLLSGL